MEKYSNLKKGSRVIGYELGSDFIKIWFDGKQNPYTYSCGEVGENHIEMMKKMAIKGHGLHRYIKRNVKKLYD